MPTAAARTEKLDLRLSAPAKRLLQEAARARHRSVTDFVLESALERAAETLPDRVVFGLDEDRWNAFQAALDAPPRHIPRLESLLKEESRFERSAKDE